MSNHIAFVPARSGSKGFPGKNSKFFEQTAQFISKSSLFDRIIVSTNDDKVIHKAKKCSFEIHKRKKRYAGPNVSIKSTIQNLINDLDFKKNDIIWLFYIPIVYKNLNDFKKAKRAFKNKKINSIISFFEVEAHPFHFWKYDRKKNKLRQFIQNDCYRRQDLPKAFKYHHYICAFKVSEIENLNSELINENTLPIFLNYETQSQLVEIDTRKNYYEWIKIKENEKA